ncbi:MAG: hypothetical protein MI743_05585 [Sneathiellales bacterium]|nr:hypothetical protein [Sneathiellales bacterium]
MFSPIKIILLVLVIGAVYIIARKLGFLGGEGGQSSQSGEKIKKDREKTTDLVKCDKCDTYVTPEKFHRCEKSK